MLLLDKSWLVGANPTEFSRVIGRFHLLAPEALLYEVLTTKSSRQRADCIRKLLSVPHSVSFLRPLGHLIRVEAETGKPCGRLLRHCHREGVDLTKLANRDYAYTQFEDMSINSEKNWRESETLTAFIESVAKFVKQVPELGSVQGLKPDQLWPKLQALVWDQARLNALYQEVRAALPNLPPRIGHQWATFRRIQAHVLLIGEFVRRYGPELKAAPTDRLVNLYLDGSYVVLGVLARAVATRDKPLKAMIGLLAQRTAIVE